MESGRRMHCHIARLYKLLCNADGCPDKQNDAIKPLLDARPII